MGGLSPACHPVSVLHAKLLFNRGLVEELVQVREVVAKGRDVALFADVVHLTEG